MAKPQPKSQNTMQLAEILSDLVSLRVCDKNAALALVSARASTSTTANQEATAKQDDDDVDLKRAKELVQLHYGVREAHKRGELGKGLEEARSAVQSAMAG